MTGERILLVGMMGSGKTSVGREVAQLTGWPYRDNDELVTESAGVDAPTLLERDGIDALRDAESAALRLAAEDPGPLVAGIAGGVVERLADVRLLKDSDALVVYLDTPIEVLIDRVGDGSGRPFLQPDPAAALRRLFAGREVRYHEAADLVVDAATGEPADLARLIVTAWRHR